MAKVPGDHDLDFLRHCTKEELEPIVGIILGTDGDGNIDMAGRFSSELQASPKFEKYWPDHTQYVDEIIEEIQTFGGNSFANVFRGHGVSYREVLTDVCDKQKVNYNGQSSIEQIEENLLCKVLREMWEKMSEEDRAKLLEEAGGGRVNIGGMTDAALIALFRAGGFASYKILLIIVNAIAKAILGRGLPLVVNAALCKWVAVLAGPVGWAIAGIWTALDLGGTAYRVTIPAAVYIAALRKLVSMPRGDAFRLENR